MGYRYETHLHTNEASACSRMAAADYIDFYKERGYSGIIVTDHFYHGNCAISRSLSWEQWIAAYCRGYELAKEAGERKGISVFFGLEENFDGDEYLVYGLTKEWLLEHPEVIKCNRREYYELIHGAGGFVVQAHPYRERAYISQVLLNPDFSDAVEILNLGNDLYMDGLAAEYAKKHGLSVTAGSDMHWAWPGAPVSGIEADRPISCVTDYIRLIRQGSGYRLIGWEERERQAQKEKPWENELPVYQYQNLDGTERWKRL